MATSQINLTRLGRQSRSHRKLGSLAVAVVALISAACSPALPTPTVSSLGASPVSATWPCQAVAILDRAEASLNQARKSLAGTDGTGAQGLAKTAHAEAMDAVAFLPPGSSSGDLEDVRVRLISADLAISQTAEVLIGDFVPTQDELPTFDKGIGATRAALSEAHGAINAASGRGLVDCSP